MSASLVGSEMCIRDSSSVVDIPTETEIARLGLLRVQDMFARFKAAREQYRHKDMEPAPDQLSAVFQRID
eukprot:4678882-Alexandrium_andersonii.AAC.1